MRIRATLIVILLCTLQTIACAQEKTVKLLTVGNSFADNALKYLPKIVEASGNKLIYSKANLGGCSLERHWNHVEKFEADPNDKAGKPYHGKYSLKDQLTKEKWDVVTIQQVSWKSHDLKTYYPYVTDLVKYIRQNSPDAKLYCQQIWAYRVDDPRFSPTNTKEGEPLSHKEMYEMNRNSYFHIAKEFNLGTLPSGDAMYLADTDAKWGYKPEPDFDKSKLEYPAKPDQTHSLHVGYLWRKNKEGKQYLAMDGHHAGKAGEYLIGCVWFETLFDQSVVDNSYVPEGLDAEYAAFLRQTAHKAVENLKAELADK
jgi:hypothetical protein